MLLELDSDPAVCGATARDVLAKECRHRSCAVAEGPDRLGGYHSVVAQLDRTGLDQTHRTGGETVSSASLIEELGQAITDPTPLWPPDAVQPAGASRRSGAAAPAVYGITAAVRCQVVCSSRAARPRPRRRSGRGGFAVRVTPAGVVLTMTPNRVSSRTRAAGVRPGDARRQVTLDGPPRSARTPARLPELLMWRGGRTLALTSQRP